MFFQGTSGSGEFANNMQEAASSIQLADLGLKSIKEKLKSGFSPFAIVDRIAALNEQTANAVRTSLGQGREITEMMQVNFANATQKTLEFGIGQKENLELFQKINAELRVNTLLTSDQITSLNILTKNAGLTQDAMAKIVEGFDTIGVGVSSAIGEISGIERMSRSYGVSVNQLLTTVSDKLSVVNSYGFQDGVRGFSRMVAKAQMLRMDVDSTLSTTRELLDPNKAIEFSTAMQQLGINAGGLTDVFRVMYNAQSDTEQFQDDIQTALASLTMFNEETGQITISPEQRRQLIEFAPRVGMAVDDAMNAAVRSRKRFETFNILDGFAELNEEEKEFLANVGQLNQGKFEVVMDDQAFDIQDILNMDSEQRGAFMDRLRGQLEEANMSDRDIAERQLGVLESIDAELKKQLFRPTSAAINNDVFMEGFEGLAGQYENSINNIGATVTQFIENDLEGTISNLSRYLGIQMDVAQEFLNNLDTSDLTNFIDSAGDALDEMTGAVDDATEALIRYERHQGFVYERQSESPTPMAEGGVVTQAVNAIVGEAGPEAVIPLDRLEQILTTSASSPTPVSVDVRATFSVDVNGIEVNSQLNDDQIQKIGLAAVNNSKVMSQIVSEVNGTGTRYGMGINNPRADNA
jgi:hypothetical protein